MKRNGIKGPVEAVRAAVLLGFCGVAAGAMVAAGPGSARAAEIDLPTGWHFSGVAQKLPNGFTNINGVLTKPGQAPISLQGANATTPDNVVYNANGQIALNSQAYRPFQCSYNSATGAVSNPNCLIAFQALFTSQQLSGAEVAARQVAVVQSQRVQAQQAVNLIGARIADALLPNRRVSGSTKQSDAGGGVVAMDGRNGISGVSAGDDQYTNSLWASYSHSWVANNWNALKSQSDINTGVVGGDVKIQNNLLLGLTFTYQSNVGTTNFNDGTLDASSYTFVPYGAISFLDNQIVLDVMSGAGFSDSSTKRSRSVAAVSGSYGSDSWMFATHATYNLPVNNWNLSAKAGWLMTYNWADRFTESNGTVNPTQVTRLGEVSLAGRAGYTIDQFEPYTGLTYAHDVILAPGCGRNDRRNLRPG